MSARPRTFHAWSLPDGAAVPDGPGPGFQAGKVRVRYPDVDAPWVRRVAEMLRQGREGLAVRPARTVAAALGRVGARFLDPVDPVRARALDLLRTAGFRKLKNLKGGINAWARDIDPSLPVY